MPDEKLKIDDANLKKYFEYFKLRFKIVKHKMKMNKKELEILLKAHFEKARYEEVFLLIGNNSNSSSNQRNCILLKSRHSRIKREEFLNICSSSELEIRKCKFESDLLFLIEEVTQEPSAVSQ